MRTIQFLEMNLPLGHSRWPEDRHVKKNSSGWL